MSPVASPGRRRRGRGRPPGWRKRGALRSALNVRLSAEDAAWLEVRSRAMKISMSDVVRDLIAAGRRALPLKGPRGGLVPSTKRRRPASLPGRDEGPQA